jgi:hypothetical protein
MSEIVSLGAQSTILVADADFATLNSSTGGDTDIAITNMTIQLYKDGAKVADETSIINSPYNFELDNIYDGRYLARLDLDTSGVYSLHVKHSTNMIAWREQDWDVQGLLDSIAAACSDGNVKIAFVKAVGAIPIRNVADGYINYMTVQVRRPGAAGWGTLIVDEILYYTYETSGDKNPLSVAAT